MKSDLEMLKTRLNAAKLELKIRERTMNQAVKGYERINELVKQLEEKLNAQNDMA